MEHGQEAIRTQKGDPLTLAEMGCSLDLADADLAALRSGKPDPNVDVGRPRDLSSKKATRPDHHDAIVLQIELGEPPVHDIVAKLQADSTFQTLICEGLDAHLDINRHRYGASSLI